MAIVEYWIQLEHRYWDAMPNNIDRMTSRDAEATHFSMDPECVCASDEVTISSPETGVSRTVKMYAPLRNAEDEVMHALIFRRYEDPEDPDDKTTWWKVPDDRKVNPWDLNEPDPTDTGTMGTIPGATIECSVGDTVIVHFRNKDYRITKSKQQRTHSMHVHGFVFKAQYDGAYPLSPESDQPTTDEESEWEDVGVTGGFKKGDRVPPGGTFDYTWDTVDYPSTAGVWLYHDHSLWDTTNVLLGAIGIVVIHNTADRHNDFLITEEDLPNGDFNGSPTTYKIAPVPLQNISTKGLPVEFVHIKKSGDTADIFSKAQGLRDKIRKVPIVRAGELILQVSKDIGGITDILQKVYRTPPDKAQYLLLFHSLGNWDDGDMVHTCINGRSFLGNTPSVLAGTSTKMRFGVVAMESFSYHTFHIHGHRWIIPGPDGTDPSTIQSSTQKTPVSQFEDTKIFGAANSFVFTIDNAVGSFMRAGGSGTEDNKGEWHMHCHVLDHMHHGMMGSLIIADGGDVVSLPVGEVPDTTVNFRDILEDWPLDLASGVLRRRRSRTKFR